MNRKWMHLPVATVGLTACMNVSSGPEQHDTRTIERDNSELVHVNLDLGAGSMKVAGGSDKLVDADFRYGANASKPDVHYDSAAGRGSLTIKQTGSSSALTQTKKEWDLRLNNAVPMEIEVNLGGREAHLNLGTLNLRDLNIQIGAGELDLDLRGAPKKSYEVESRAVRAKPPFGSPQA